MDLDGCPFWKCRKVTQKLDLTGPSRFVDFPKLEHNTTVQGHVMSDPVVVLDRDCRLDQRALLCYVSGAPKCLQVCLARDEKLDRRASNYFRGSQGIRRQRRKQRTLKQNGRVKADTLGRRRKRRTSAHANNQDGSKQATLSDELSSRSNISQHKDISKEEFMALLSLSPTHLALRVRKCNRPRYSKYFRMKSQDLWRKICGERNNRYCTSVADTESVLRPSFVLLERSNFVDHLALSPVSPSICLKSLKNAATHRKRSSHRNLHTPSVVLNRDSGLDRLALQASNVICDSPSSNSSRMSIINPCEAKVTSTVLPYTGSLRSSHELEKPSLKRISVDIIRDSRIDQLAQQNSTTTITDDGFGCENFVTCQLKPPFDCLTSISPITKLSQDTENSCHHSCKEIFVAPAESEIPRRAKARRFRNAIIKLRRISGDDWLVIQPDGPGLETSGPRKPDLELYRSAYHDLFQPQSSSSNLSQSSISHTGLPRFSSEQRLDAGVVTCCSARKSLSSVPCSKSPERTKSVPNVEELLSPDLHHNENKNPQENAIPPAKAVTESGEHSSAVGVVKSLVWRNIKNILENELVNEPLAKLGAARQKDLLETSISRYKPVKKPLSVKSEFYSTFNINQPSADSCQANSEQDTVG